MIFKIPTRRALLAAAALLMAGAAVADEYPAKPIRLVVPFPPGGPTDTYGRLVGKLMGDALGQPVIVENRNGATGLIGTNMVKSAAPDGYTLLYTSNSAQVIGPLLRTPRPFDPVADFTPIAEPLRYSLYLLVSSKVPANTFKEFVALARSKPGKFSYASVGTGSVGHLACELMNGAAGIEALHVPYKGAGPAQVSVVAGDTDYLCDSVGNSQPMVLAGKLKGLALTAESRSASIPDIPTMTEEGVPVVAYVWQGVFAPKGLPDDIRAKLEAAIAKAINTPELRERIRNDGYEAVAQSHAQLTKDITAESAMWEKIIQTKGIKVENGG
ncbi:Bug family tripartite tricarboxylate transporter substrate binding protein [Achromobacter aloeverae]|uniref:Tripartite tricarboxylate transporter substrate binding protein n=1 Tax=Achromobacter aloeverae TaxID=1750518 RepID=A0A4Q1HFV2_9BURK|nr:tripartite tricarboxylate transporter substrate binding protein [Achromobacter aloeverae]RXN85949.1 hypothetical protein C7R54_19480 [Achromobacter aloeverae]